MNNWPDGWTDDGRGRAGRGGPPQPEQARAMPHVRGSVPRQNRGGYDGAGDHGYGGYDGYGGYGGYDDRRSGYRDDGYGGRGDHAGHGGHGGRNGYDDHYDDHDGYRERSGMGQRIKRGLILLILLLLVLGVGTYFWADSKMRREVDLSAVEQRPESGRGTTYLIVGTDSREGLTEEERREMRTGQAEGARADTIMVLHTGDHGSSLISLPRDSWVTIPEFTGSSSGNRIPEQRHKLNAAYAIEGPELLVRTVEHNTGLRIDHYAEIGFGGFANVVDALGGVEMCFDAPIQDKNSGADFAEGCQDLDGPQSLAFVRQRYQESMGDLGRTKNQQKFLGALGDQVASPATLLNPFRLYPTMGASLDSLVVDESMGPFRLAQMFLALRGVQGSGGTQMNVPVANPGFSTDKGSAVLWDEERADQLFEQVRRDQPITVTDD